MRHALVYPLIASLAAAGCTTTSGDISLGGSWGTEFGSTHTISNDTWTENGDGYTNMFAITMFDNDTMYAIAQNDSSNDYNPDLWSRFDWTVDGSGDTWFCQSTFDAATEEDAMAVARGDDSDPATTGCGDYSWTKLTASAR